MIESEGREDALCKLVVLVNTTLSRLFLSFPHSGKWVIEGMQVAGDEEGKL